MIEEDVHGRESIAYKVMKTLNQQEKHINSITENDWVKHYKQLWFEQNIEDAPIRAENAKGLDDTDLRELTDALRATKNRKATGLDGINAEMWTYGSLLLHLRLLHFFKMCWKSGMIPETGGEQK